MATGRFHSKVAGVTAECPFTNRPRQAIIPVRCRRGTELIAVREPDNPRDANAIALLVKFKALFLFPTTYNVGYISADLAPELARYIDNGGELQVLAKQITGGGNKKYGLNIVINKLKPANE